MERLELLQDLSFDSDSKILFWVFDGVGGLPHPETGQTEMETANTPNLDALASRSVSGGLEPFGAGITPGSGPGHLSIFGYPVGDFDLPRGVLEVLGASDCFKNGEEVDDFRLQSSDLAMRGNYATLETRGDKRIVTDRRANRPSTEEGREYALALSRQLELEGYEIFVFPGKEHRFALVIRGSDLSSGLTDGDPQKSGREQPEVRAERPEAKTSANLVNDVIEQATEILGEEGAANTVLLRGIGTPPDIPTLEELYGIRCAAIATYPMYKGIAQLVGMDVIDVGSMDHADEVKALEENFEKYDFFYLHIKETDSYSHAGEFDKKVGVFEACDPLVQRALELDWDAVVVTGDHCTPCVLKEHSWHPIPTLLWSPTVLVDETDAYTERQCARGGLGIRPSRDILPLALAEARRLKKFGA
ncbi:MAG: 2,3-bisphosphoglycerate-independent phosphoglycerate mutase [Myxococcota bacterium]